MEGIGVIAVVCLALIVLFTQVAARQLKNLNFKIDELIRVVKHE